MTPTPRLADLPDLLTVPETAAVLRVHENTVYAAVARGEYGAYRPSPGRIVIPKRCIAEIVNGSVSHEAA